MTATLTKEERKEVAAWIEGYATLGRLKRELAARTLQEQLELAQEWFADQKGDEIKGEPVVVQWDGAAGTYPFKVPTGGRVEAVLCEEGSSKPPQKLQNIMPHQLSLILIH